MQEPYSEGVANHADLESCAGSGDIAGEALTEVLAGRLSSREIPRFGCRPCGQKGKAISIVASSQAACEPGAGVGFVHGAGGIARRIASLTEGQSFARSAPDFAVTTGDLDDFKRLAPAFAQLGIEDLRPF